MTDSPDRETEELLDELETTLEALREEVDGRNRRRRGPPTPLELLRLTERHAIPTLVATLEATVAALELVREVIRLVDPERSSGRVDEAGDRLGRAGDSAVVGAERVLADLRRALDAADLPDDEAARPLVAEARELSAEVEARLREARDEPGARGASGDDGGVRIDVTEDEKRGEAEEESGDEEGAADAGVDVDAELESIRDEVRDDQDETR
ncbi:MAG: hypothetical protein ABEH47_08895 [Haloferacaceae archaeon]